MDINRLNPRTNPASATQIKTEYPNFRPTFVATNPSPFPQETSQKGTDSSCDMTYMYNAVPISNPQDLNLPFSWSNMAWTETMTTFPVHTMVQAYTSMPNCHAIQMYNNHQFVPQLQRYSSEMFCSSPTNCNFNRNEMPFHPNYQPTGPVDYQANLFTNAATYSDTRDVNIGSTKHTRSPLHDFQASSPNAFINNSNLQSVRRYSLPASHITIPKDDYTIPNKTQINSDSFIISKDCTYDEASHALGLLAKSKPKVTTTKRKPKQRKEPRQLNRKIECTVEGCSKVFKRAEHLKRHLNSVHNPVKAHACRFENCTKAFSRSDNLNQHFKTHLKKLKVKENKNSMATAAVQKEQNLPHNGPSFEPHHIGNRLTQVMNSYDQNENRYMQNSLHTVPNMYQTQHISQTDSKFSPNYNVTN